MRKTVSLLLALFVFAGVCRAYSPVIDGALADVRLKVVDDRGEAVSNAAVSVTFHVTPEKADVRRGTTDGDGVFSAKGRCIGEAYAWIRRDGYYETKIAPTFRKLSYEDAKRTRRWSDGTVETVAVLKRVRNPVVTAFHLVDYAKIPATNEIVRLDLETFKWCPPHGDGLHDDLHLFYEVWRNPTNWFSFRKKLTVTAPNCVDGFYLADVDMTSKMRYEYHARTNETYVKNIVYEVDRRGGKPDRVELPPDGCYFTFRMRTETNELGKVMRANYGRIGERSDHMFGLRMKAWFNTKINDTNLEDARLR